MNERFPSSEISDVDLVAALKSPGIKDLNVIGMLFTWTMEGEAKIDKTPRAQIEFDVRKGKIYLFSGHYDEARDMFRGALLRAEQEVIPDLCESISVILRKMSELA